jgi:hypothetical protein
VCPDPWWKASQVRRSRRESHTVARTTEARGLADGHMITGLFAVNLWHEIANLDQCTIAVMGRVIGQGRVDHPIILRLNIQTPLRHFVCGKGVSFRVVLGQQKLIRRCDMVKYPS